MSRKYRVKGTDTTGYIISKRSRQGDQVWIMEMDNGTPITVNKNDVELVIDSVAPDDNGNMEVWGGFGKWSFGWNREQASVEIGLHSYPNHVSISLYDGSPEDFQRIADMFTTLANGEYDIAMEEMMARFKQERNDGDPILGSLD